MPDTSAQAEDATLTIVRRWANAGSIGPVEIHVDGDRCGVVSNDGFAVVRCRPGTHEVVVSQFGRYSQTVCLIVAPGARGELVCRCKMPLERLSRVVRSLMIALAAFALLYITVPAVKPALKPYEKYWGPVLLVATGVVAVLGAIQIALVNLFIHMSKPGQFIELAERQPTISEEQIRAKSVTNAIGTGNP